MKLRELFSIIKLKSDKANKDLEDFDDALDDVSDGLEDVEEGAEDTGRALAKLGGAAKSIGSTIAKGIGIGVASLTAAVTATTAFVANWASAADSIGKDAGKFEIAAEELQALMHAAELSGSSADKLKDGLKDLGLKVRETLENPVSDAGKVFATLGINVEKFAQLGAEDRLATLADALSNVDDKSARLSFRTRLLGEAGVDLGELFRNGAAGVHAMTDEARELGGIMGDEALQAAADFNDEMARAQLQFKGLRNEIGAKLAPILTQLLRKWRTLSTAQREAIVDRLVRFFERVIRLAEDLIPQIGNLAEGIAGFSESIGGVDAALKLVIGTFAAFKIAAFAALGPAAPWLAGVVAAITLISTLSSTIDGARRSAERADNEAKHRRENRDKEAREARSRAERTQAFTDEELRATPGGRALLAARAERDAIERRLAELDARQESDPLVQRTRDLLEGLSRAAGAEAAASRVSIESRLEQQLEEQRRERQVAHDDVIAARERVAKAEEELGIEAETEANQKRRENDAKSKRDKAEQERKDEEDRKLRKELITLQTKTRRTRAEQKRLAVLSEHFGVPIIATPKGVGRVFGEDGAKGKQEKPKTIAELIAEAVGQGTGLAGGQLRPAGLGTTINHIDASVRVQAPQITIHVDELPPTANAREVAREVSTQVGDSFVEQLREAFDIQVRQVQG